MKIADDDDGLRAAEKVATLSPYKNGHRVGAVITDKRGNVLGMSCNRKKTHPIQAKYATIVGDPCRINIHAEIGALINMSGGKPHKIYVARLTKRNATGLAKPCPICARAIEDAGIQHVVYTT